MAGFRDVAQLINAPEYPNSVQWADDGTLAVAEGSCVGILHPGSLSGAQAFAAVEGFAQDTVIAAPGKPNSASIHFDMALSLRLLLSPVKESGGGKGNKSSKESTTASQCRRPLSSAKSIAWSPSGAATAGGCLLAAVTNDYRVIIFGPDGKLDPEWRPLFTIHENLLNYLTETRWEAIDAVTLLGGAAELVDDDDNEEEVLRLRGGAGGSSELEDEELGDDVKGEKQQAAKKKKPAAKKQAAPAAKNKATATQKPAPAAGNRRKAAAPQLAPAGDATDLGTSAGAGSSTPASAAATAALAAQAVLAGIPPVDFHDGRLAKLDIADTVAKRFFELRRQHDPDSLPIYEKSNTHLRAADKDNLEQAFEEYFKVYGEKLAEIAMDKDKFWKECRIALPRCWNRQKNVFLEGFEETIGGGFGPGGTIQEETESEGDSDMTEDEVEAGEEAGGSRRLRKKRAAAGTREHSEEEEGEERNQRAAKRKKRAPAVKDPFFEREPFELPFSTATTAEGEGAAAAAAEEGEAIQEGNSPASSAAAVPFTWRDLPPVDNTNRTTLKNTLIEGAVKRFLRLRAAEPAALLPTYPSQKSFLKGVDAWIQDRVMKEYFHGHAPAMVALQYDLKKFVSFFNTRLRQVWDRSFTSSDETTNNDDNIGGSASGGGLLEANYDIYSDNGLVHPQGSGEDGLLGPVPIHDKVDPSAGKKIKEPKPRIGGKSTGGGVSGGGGGGGASTSRAAANVSTTTTGRGKGGAVGYGKESLGGTQWWGGSDINSDVYERRLLSISAISAAWSPTVTTTEEEGSFSFLAVGTKEGGIWLWRCQHPAAPAVPGTVEEESVSLGERMTLIGRLPGNLSWVNTMKWVSIPSPAAGGGAGAGGAGASRGAVLVLVVGSSDGSVTLWGTDSSTLASFSAPITSSSSPSSSQQQQQQQQLPMEKWNTLLHLDLTQVISIDASLRYTTTTAGEGTTTQSGVGEGAQLVVAIGKSAGVVVAWTSSEFSLSSEGRPTTTTATAATSNKGRKGGVTKTSSVGGGNSSSNSIEKVKVVLQQRGQLLKTQELSGLGSSSVTGVGLAAGAEMVVACTREGALESWSLPMHVNSSGNAASGSGGSGVGVLQPRSSPVACSVRKQKESGFGSFGVAISPGGVFVAIPKSALPAGTDYVK
jgi:hypothetical protein